MQWKGKRVMIYGAARSGISAAALLQRLGASVLLFDCNTKLSEDSLQDRLDTNVNFLLVTGILREENLSDIELLIISPGVPTDHPDIIKIKEKNIPVWGEIELAYQCSLGKIIGITGTNGKTTTTTLVGEIIKSYFEEVYVGGNIGTSYSDTALDTTEQAITVIELSSFQLETIHGFRPDISVILNITPDHLDRHYTMDHYIEMKKRITLNQMESDLCILNYEDESLRAMSYLIKPKVMFFSSRRELSEGLYLEGNHIVYKQEGSKQIVCNIKELKILGSHNYENVMAAVAISLAMNIPMEDIRRTLIDFQGVEHRIEFVETINGVTYYNDSKGTNPDASIRAVLAMRSPTILIAGGYDKKVSFDNLIEAFGGKVRYLVLLGQTKEELAKTARSHGFTDIIMTESLKEAVRVSTEKAVPGDAILLSPACASWGMFDNYEQRGNFFKEYVREMIL
jgi:UDP-N-acetylmuramoylalanine--D-glutamate ligase